MKDERGNAALIAILVIMMMIGVGIFARAVAIAMLPVRAVDRTITTAQGIIDKTLTADNAIYNYSWFLQQKEDIVASELKIQLAEKTLADFELVAGDRANFTFEDKNYDSQLRSIVQGLKSNRESMIADYNAHAKDATKNIFLDGKIPQFIEVGSNLLR